MGGESGLNLEELGDLGSLLDQKEAANGGPLEIPLDLIDEDPNQPRKEDNPGFSSLSLNELSATIKARGVKTPISVRPNEEVEGRFIINHGARRYRASQLAERETIPAWIDLDYSEADQVIENLQRDNLTAREIADFIGRELAKKKKKGQIAKELGKSAAFVTQHAALLDLPEAIADAFNSGRVKDVTVVNELLKAHKKSSEDVERWLDDDSQEITRGSVGLLREFLDEKDSGGEADPAGGGEPGGDDPGPTQKKTKNEPDDDPDKLKKAWVLVEHDKREARLMLNRRPDRLGQGWIKYEDDGHEVCVELEKVSLVQVREG